MTFQIPPRVSNSAPAVRHQTNVRGISPEMRVDESGCWSWTRFFYLPKRLFLLALGVRVSKRGTLMRVQAAFFLISCSGWPRDVPRISFICRYCSWGCLSAACLWLETQSPPWHPRPGIALGMSVWACVRQAGRETVYIDQCVLLTALYFMANAANTWVKRAV